MAADLAKHDAPGMRGLHARPEAATAGERAAARAGAVLLAAWVAWAGGLHGCAAAGPSDPMRYRLAESGTHWDVVDRDRVLDDLQPRYPEFFAVVLDPTRSDEADLRTLRDDLEASPVTRTNYDALNAVALAYFELNFRAEAFRHSGDMEFLSAGMRSAKLAAVPWRAYGEIGDPALRDAILDFFEDVATSEKLGARATAGRLARVVESLAPKEDDPDRLARIEAIAARMRAADLPPDGSPR